LFAVPFATIAAKLRLHLAEIVQHVREVSFRNTLTKPKCFSSKLRRVGGRPIEAGAGRASAWAMSFKQGGVE